MPKTKVNMFMLIIIIICAIIKQVTIQFTIITKQVTTIIYIYAQYFSGKFISQQKKKKVRIQDLNDVVTLVSYYSLIYVNLYKFCEITVIIRKEILCFI
jgi:hypothetical protein